MRHYVALVLLLLTSCALPPQPMRQSVSVEARLVESKDLSVRIHNQGAQTLEYAWPLAMASDDRSPVECPLPTADFQFEVRKLASNRTVSLTIGSWDQAGYVGVWVRRGDGDAWKVAWSRTPVSTTPNTSLEWTSDDKVPGSDVGARAAQLNRSSTHKVHQCKSGKLRSRSTREVQTKE